MAQRQFDQHCGHGIVSSSKRLSRLWSAGCCLIVPPSHGLVNVLQRMSKGVCSWVNFSILGEKKQG